MSNQRRPNRSSHWVIQIGPDGEDTTILQRGRSVRSEVSVDEARRYVRKRRRANERVYQEEPDGYRTEIKTV
jgi:hypothetical protein